MVSGSPALRGGCRRHQNGSSSSGTSTSSWALAPSSERRRPRASAPRRSRASSPAACPPRFGSCAAALRGSGGLEGDLRAAFRGLQRCAASLDNRPQAQRVFPPETAVVGVPSDTPMVCSVLPCPAKRLPNPCDTFAADVAPPRPIPLPSGWPHPSGCVGSRRGDSRAR